MNIDHCLRFGTHAENQFFLGDNAVFYKSIIFNGNMVAYTRSAIAAFIISSNGKDFIIDPQTHAFQHDPSYLKSINSKGESKVKRSIQLLAESLGNPALSNLENGLPIVPSNFDDYSVLNSFASGTIAFQKDIINHIKKHKDWEYLKFKLEAEGKEEPKPAGLIAPYFYMTEFTLAQWLNINVKLITASKEKAGSDNLMAQLVISKDILTSPSLTDVINAYKSCDATTILFWIDSLNEVEASKLELDGLKRLAKELTKSGKKVVNLYGGFYSIMLANKGYLSGVCHGLEYGESRAVVPVGGGIPMAKYYPSPLHFRMRYPDLITVFGAKGWGSNPNEFKEKVCDCSLCEEGDITKFGITNPVRTRRGANIITLNYPTTETKRVSLLHYLYSKKKEFDTAEQKSIEEIKADLQTAKAEYENILGLEAVSHIDRWITSIDDNN